MNTPNLIHRREFLHRTAAGVAGAAVFEIWETTGGTQWSVCEHESSKDPVGTMRRTFAAQKKFGLV